MRRFMYLWMLIGASFFAVGCGPQASGPEEGSAADEAAIEEDLGMQEELMGDLDAGTDDTTGAPE